MIKPNVFIVGAPKCGTTELCHYLSQHLSAYVPRRKEFHFFGSSLRYHYRVRDLSEYLSYYNGGDNARIFVDGSVWYLYAPDSAREIFDFNPHARIIVMLRRPDHMLMSLHQQYVWNGYEPLHDFSAALAAERARAEGRGRAVNKRIMSRDAAPSGLVYWNACDYATQLERFLAVFPDRQILVIPYDDFKLDTRKSFESVCEFLSIEHMDLPRVEKINGRKYERIVGLKTCLEKLPFLAPQAFRHMPGQRRIRKFFNDFNTLHATDEPHDQLSARILEYYAPEIKRLTRLTGMDFDRWL